MRTLIVVLLGGLVLVGNVVGQSHGVGDDGDDDPSGSVASRADCKMVQLTLGDQTPLHVLVDYVSGRLKLNILYDEQLANKRISIRAPRQVPVGSLLRLLESALRMKGLVLVDSSDGGFKRIVKATHLEQVAVTTTQRSVGLKTPAVTRVFVLEHVSVQKLSQTLRTFLTQPGGNAVALSDQRMLIVTDYASNMNRIERLVALADRPGESVTVKFIRLRHADAGKVASQLTGILSGRQRAGGERVAGDRSSAQVGFDARTNQLIVTGSMDQQEQVRQLAGELDKPVELVTEVYRLGTIGPDRVDMLMKSQLGRHELDRLYRSALDKESQSLVVTTTATHHARLKRLLEALDQPIAEAQSPVRFYKLENATASDVLKILREIAGDSAMADVQLQDAGRGGSEPGRSAAWLIKSASAKDGRVDLKGDALPGSVTDRSDAISPQSSVSGVGESVNRGNQIDSAIDAGAVRVTADPNTNTIIVIADPRTQKIYEQLIKVLDRRRPQVLIECTLVTIDTGNDFTLSVDMSVKGRQDNTKVLNFSSSGVAVADTTNGTLAMPVDLPLGYTGALLDLQGFYLVINALKNNGRSRVVASPRILVNDNATGKLVSAQEQPTKSTTIGTTTDTTGFGGYVKAGTTIDVTPHIAEGDHLKLDYSIALNAFDGQSDSAQGIPAPRQTNEIASQVTIPDSYTIVVGGLNRSDWSKFKSVVPGVGEVPILEYLFGSHSEQSREATLFVFIRATILRDQQFRDLKYLSARNMNNAGMKGDFPVSEPVLME